MFKRLPPLNSLKAFERAAQNLSFTKAAEELYVTQAAISHQVKLLEDFLGVELFVRKNRALELTEQGERYYAEISPLLYQISEATQKLMRQNRPHLTVCVPQTFANYWLVPHLSSFNAQYPNIDVRIKAADHDEDLLTGDTDIAVYYGEGKWKNVNVEALSNQRLVMLASPKLLQASPILHKNDLLTHNLIHIYTRENWKAMAEHLSLTELNIQQGVVFSHTFMGLQAAIHGQGIVIANRVLAQQEIENGNLQIVLPTTLNDPKAFFVVNDIKNNNDPTICAFREWILATMEENE
ncbi:LysR family glycine cleavage system transcriptional activator [Pasteurella langaaensis DSM 22999]|uniref:LysR family glycine cleavage system transcriptional activator n=1 Tax=Alitibacter langaaensis DSM 22999 TaxID=1122935 RepID=A0A2U0TAG8_9PAST|nr:transcriptional regulator GcvA [Pasteurella langaaensis]PVX40596.1 LysR family glycine cleavage system transcriptional activator [Pasteurella langaaensis DSM 22999]